MNKRMVAHKDSIRWGSQIALIPGRTPNGLVTQLSYTPRGWTDLIKVGTDTVYETADLDYDGVDQLIKATLPDGSYLSYTYDAAHRLTVIVQAGNPANDQSYGYDPLYRLTSASGPLGTQGYGYDANGNRSSATLNGQPNSYAIAANSNRLQSAHGKTYSHDANGNTTSDGLHSYSYDARNRLTGVDANISYTLNGLGQRTRKTVPGIDITNTTAGDANGDGTINAQDYSAILNHILGTPASNDADCNQDGQVNVQDLVCINIKINPSLRTTGGATYFAYDEQGQLIGEYDQSGTAIQETIYLGNLPVAVIKQGNVYRLFADHLNTPRAIADATNTVVWRWQSDAFGTTAANEDVDGDGAKFSYNLRFPGQYFDQETGLHYNYFRDYDPGTGRYVESDPIGLEGGLNTYTYADSLPITKTDTYGLSTYSCKRRLGKKPGEGGSINLFNPGVYHQYSCVYRNGSYICGGHTSSSSSVAESIINTEGRATTSEEDYYHPDSCKLTRDDNECFEKCMIREWAKDRPSYGVHPGISDCQEYDDDLHLKCANECKGRSGGKDKRFPWEKFGR